MRTITVTCCVCQGTAPCRKESDARIELPDHWLNSAIAPSFVPVCSEDCSDRMTSAIASTRRARALYRATRG